MLDPENRIVKLCVTGMEAEAANRFDMARSCFEQAWAAQQNDLDAAIAAHYLARHQDTLERILHWNQVALHHAERASKSIEHQMAVAVAQFFPSLYLNLGKSYEDMGDVALARHYYARAAEQLAQLGAASAPAAEHEHYLTALQRGIAAALHRTRC